jgi:hypothetical protein
MGFVTASFKLLGARCWSAERFTSSCFKCGRYDACTYPERVANVQYDELRETAADLRRQSDTLYSICKEMKNGGAL